jgi:hypothetical protein
LTEADRVRWNDCGHIQGLLRQWEENGLWVNDRKQLIQFARDVDEELERTKPLADIAPEAIRQTMFNKDHIQCDLHAQHHSTPDESDALFLAVQRLVSVIRNNLPLIGEPPGPPMITPSILRMDLDGDQKEATFADLLKDAPKHFGPDQYIRVTPNLQNVETALRGVCRLLDSLSEKGLGRVRGLLRQLLDSPLYWWQWTGSTPAERGADGVVRPGLFSPVQLVTLPVDVDLLQEFREAARGAAGRDQGGLGGGVASRQMPPGKISKLALALATLSDHPDWTNKQISLSVGCSLKYLSQAPKFKAARTAIRGLGQERQTRDRRSRGADMDRYAEGD